MRYHGHHDAYPLIFPLAALEPILQHAESAPATSVGFADLGNPSVWLPGVEPGEYGLVKEDEIDQSKIGKSLFIVKDHGIYLMSAGKPRQLVADGSEHSVVLYATGFHPDKDPDWYGAAITAVGGDDFGERIEVAEIRKLMRAKPTATQLVFEFSGDTFQFFVE